MEKKRQGENNSCERKTRIWEPTGKGNVEIDLTVAPYHEWLDRILEDNANARDRQPFNIWGECQTLICQSKQLLSEAMASLGRCCGSRLYIYKDQPGWCVKDRVLIEDKEELQNPDVALIFAAPPRYSQTGQNILAWTQIWHFGPQTLVQTWVWSLWMWR